MNTSSEPERTGENGQEARTLMCAVLLQKSHSTTAPTPSPHVVSRPRWNLHIPLHLIPTPPQLHPTPSLLDVAVLSLQLAVNLNIPLHTKPGIFQCISHHFTTSDWGKDHGKPSGFYLNSASPVFPPTSLGSWKVGFQG